MEIQRVRKQKLKIGFSPATAFGLVLLLTWTRYTLVSFGLMVVQRIPLIGDPIIVIYPLIIGVLVLLAFPWMMKKMRVTELMIYLITIIAIVLSSVLYPQNVDAINEQLGRILTMALPMLFVGVCYDDERYKKLLFWASLLSMLAMFAYQNYQLALGRELLEDDMEAAYRTAPHVMYLLYYACMTKRQALLCWLVAVFGMMSLFIYGTRGPILCAMVFLAVILILNLQKSQSVWKKLLSVAFIIVVLVLLFSGSVMINTAESLSELFDDWGFSTRVFDAFVEGEIADDTGRGRLIARAWTAIWEKPLFGYGLMGDRVQLGNYPHHLFLELWLQFGLLFGTAVAVAIIVLPLRALYTQRHNRQTFVFLLMLVCMNFVKLMLSSSYILEWPFFFMIGVCLAMIRKPTSVEQEYTNSLSDKQ